MKRSLIIIICLLTTSILFAQKKEWKQMEDFHTVMSKSYHPVEEGNFQPAKDNANTLFQKARAWQVSPVPTGYNAKQVKFKLIKLVRDCKALKEAVNKKKSNDELKNLITIAHTTFHGIMEDGEK